MLQLLSILALSNDISLYISEKLLLKNFGLFSGSISIYLPVDLTILFTDSFKDLPSNLSNLLLLYLLKTYLFNYSYLYFFASFKSNPLFNSIFDLRNN